MVGLVENGDLDGGQVGMALPDEVATTLSSVRALSIRPFAATGKYATGDVDVQQAGTVIPAQAVQRGPNGTYVFTLAADGTAEMRPVVPTQIENGIALIRAGLQ